MEDNKNGGYSADGRKLRPRRPRVAKAASFSENGGYHSERRNYQGERNGEDRGYRPRRSDNYSDRPRRGGYGPRREHDESRGNAFADNSSYVTEEDSRGYNRGSYGERRGYGQRSDRTRRSYQDGQRRSYSEGGERRSYSEGGERRSYSASRGPRPAQGKGRGPAPKKNAPRKNAAAEGIKRMISRKPQVHEGENVESFTPLAKDEVRLNKFIANSGVCSRREADQMIQAGVVTVNGEVVTELGSKIKPGVDDVRFNGERLKGEEKVYIVMNKPRGYVTSASDPHADKTVMDLLKNCAFRVFPVGRLDKNTTGVLMFTNDGEIAERLTHPSFDKKKIYHPEHSPYRRGLPEDSFGHNPWRRRGEGRRTRIHRRERPPQARNRDTFRQEPHRKAHIRVARIRCQGSRPRVFRRPYQEGREEGRMEISHRG